MKRFVNKFAFAVIAAAVTFTACEKNDGPVPDPDWIIITFDQTPQSQVAGPTSYGENLYSTYGGEQFTTCDYADFITFGITPSDGTYDFWNGGVAVSNWNLRSNPEGKSGDWWYSYLNQCSVFNLRSADGSNRNAGNGGSDCFAVVNSSLVGSDKIAEIAMSDGREHYFTGMYVCNSAYAYGVMVNGNDYAAALSEEGGYFELVVQGFSAGSSEPVAEDRFTLADFRGGNSNIVTTWTPFALNNISRQPVSRIVLMFDGSDVGEWGLNTPTYVCIDDLCVSYRAWTK